MILAVSDVHLGYDKCNKGAFLKFLDEIKDEKIDDLVLLGDFFDFWRRNNREIVLENEDVVEKLNKLNAENIHYIIGNHDYYMYNLGQRYGDHFPFTISKNLRLTSGEKTFYFIHGYEFEALSLEPMNLEMYEEFSEKMCSSEDLIGGVASRLWDVIQGTDIHDKLKTNTRERLENLKETEKIYNFAISESKCFLLGMKVDERLIFGHTHGPFINKEKTVANTGSWIDELKSKEYQNSYVEINNGKMELKFFKH